MSYLAYQQRWREANKRYTLGYAARYRADNPEKIRTDAESYRSKPENQQIARERAAAFRRANPKLRMEYDRRRRARKLATIVDRITPGMLAAKFAYWGDRCWMCGDTERLAVDHVKPLTKGGWHVLANIRPACLPCNARKSDRWPFPAASVG